MPRALATGLKCRCPRCGAGKLFHGFLAVLPACAACGLSYDFIDVDDGAAVFIILIAGFLVTFAALLVEVRYQPPYWLHAVLWAPFATLLTLICLRPMKAWIIARQYHYKFDA